MSTEQALIVYQEQSAWDKDWPTGTSSPHTYDRYMEAVFKLTQAYAAQFAVEAILKQR